jgi:hypothetical protein
MSNYILTLDFIKKHCEEVAGQWNGDESGKQEEDAQTANEVLKKVQEIEELLHNIL